MPLRQPVDIVWSTYGYSLATRVSFIRRFRGISQEKLAELIGMHRNQVSNIERNVSSGPDSTSDPHLSVIYRIAKALDVPPAYLLPDLETLMRKRSPEQESKAAVSRVEKELERLLVEQRRT